MANHPISLSVVLTGLISKPEDASVFLLFLLAANRLVRVEIPADSKPKNAASVFAGIYKRINRIVGCNVPSPCIKHVGHKSRQSQRFVKQLLANANVAVMYGLGSELLEILRSSQDILCLNCHSLSREKVQRGTDVKCPSTIGEGDFLPVATRFCEEHIGCHIHIHPP